MNELWKVNNKDMSIELSGKNLIKTWWFLTVGLIIFGRILTAKSENSQGIDDYLSLEYFYLFFYGISIHLYLETRKLIRLVGE